MVAFNTLINLQSEISMLKAVELRSFLMQKMLNFCYSVFILLIIKELTASMIKNYQSFFSVNMFTC